MYQILTTVLLLFTTIAHAQKSGMDSGKLRTRPGLAAITLKIPYDKLDFTPCLAALNETETWKNKIFPLDPLGHTFLVKFDGNTMKVVGEDATYTMSTKPDCTTHINPDPLAMTQTLYNMMATKNPGDKAAVIAQCKGIPLVFATEGNLTSPHTDPANR